jgi:predicted phosphodiesterase
MKDQKTTNSRRKFLTNAAKVAGVGTIGFVYFKGCKNDVSEIEPPPEDKHVFVTKPYLHSLDENTMSIRWLTNKTCYSWVEYGTDDNLNLKMDSSTDGSKDAFQRIHEIILTDLVPGKTYKYRVASKEMKNYIQDAFEFGTTIYSDTYHFSTVPHDAASTSFLVLNDLHDRPESIDALFQINKDDAFDFVFLNGDMFNHQSKESQIVEHLLKPVTKNFATTKPLLYVKGNHEERGPFAKQIKNYFSYPQGQYFTFQKGPLFCIALDTGECNPDDDPFYKGLAAYDAYRESQAVWLEKVMQTDAYKNAKFRVVFMHIPTFYLVNSMHTRHGQKVFSPLFDRYNVDLVIAGHTHVYGVHPPVKGQHNYPIVIGGGPMNGNRTLIKVKATAQKINLLMFDDKGKEVGKYTVNAV